MAGRRKVRWKELPAGNTRTTNRCSDRAEFPTFEQPEPFRVSDSGVKWFRIDKPAHRPYTASGSPRQKAEAGIYLDMIGV